MPDDETFLSFYTASEHNHILVETLKSMLTNSGFRYFYLWSTKFAGKTHLLHASCSFLSDENRSVSYISCEQHALFSPTIFEGLEHTDLVCLDNIEYLIGESMWEEAVFDLFNRLYENRNTCLVISGSLPPTQLNVVLPDLKSRLSWGQVYNLQQLDDADKLKALQLRAKIRGFELPDEVGLFLLKRLDRDMRFLFNTLEKLDIASIAEQRKLTVPFVKTILSL